jgi:hypothetical protein
MPINILSQEKKIHSQNGEDGIFMYLLKMLKIKNNNFIEIGCSDGLENNSRNLLNVGLNGTGVDIDWNKLIEYHNITLKNSFEGRVKLKSMKVSIDNFSEIMSMEGNNPDIFSLDIDGNDYYIADALLRAGFRPSIACLEVNSFLGKNPLIVEYQENFSRYKLQPNYGLYFGASPSAWRELWTRYGYRTLGIDSTGTNIFFVLPERFFESIELIEESPDVHQHLFVNKYKKTGDELSDILLNTEGLKFLDVTTDEYENYFLEISQRTNSFHNERATFVTTFDKSIYDKDANKLIESFDRYWPNSYDFLALSENCEVQKISKRIFSADLESSVNGLKQFKARHRFNPGANGRFGDKYNHIFDSVKSSDKVFAIESAANICDSEILVYIDSNIITFDDVPESFLCQIFPKEFDIAFMPKKNMHSECSFVLYRQRNPYVRSFIFEHAEIYRKDLIFQLPGWTDSHVFDYLVKKYLKNSVINFLDINKDMPNSSHPFINGPLGRYMCLNGMEPTKI